MTGSERILASYRRVKDRAPEGARLGEVEHCIVYFVGDTQVANFHANKSVASFAWLDDKNGLQWQIEVLPYASETEDVIDRLWLDIFNLDIEHIRAVAQETT